MKTLENCIICSLDMACASQRLFEFPSVTSDSRPWSPGRSVAICPNCSLMKRIVSPESMPDFEDVYKDYEMFRQSNSVDDQKNFDQGGISEGRTKKILDFIKDKLEENPSRILDIGAGSGAGLVVLANNFPNAKIDGFEPNDRPAERQKNLPSNVINIFKERPKEEKYDLVTLFHVFEHIDDVFGLLSYIKSILSKNSHLLIQVPYPITGPFDLVIADHIWHFTKKSLATILTKAGYSITYLGNDLIEKELTLLATNENNASEDHAFDETEHKQSLKAIEWLVEYKLFLDGLRESSKKLVIYGTAPAAAWASSVLGDIVDAHIDDDPNRTNKSFNGKPVFFPDDIDSSHVVVAPFPDYQAKWIAQRNEGLNIVLFNDHQAA